MKRWDCYRENLQVAADHAHSRISISHSRFDAHDSQPEEVYLNLVLEFVPETIYRIIKHYSRTKRQVPGLYVKVRTIARGSSAPCGCCALRRIACAVLAPAFVCTL